MIGQLMRIHLAIPDGPIEAKIRPKVQPGPSPCALFFPEAEDPITLHPGLWIMRLPYPFIHVSLLEVVHVLITDRFLASLLVCRIC